VNPPDHAWIAAAVGIAGTALGWLARGMTVASQWGALRTEVKGLRTELQEFKTAYQAHLRLDDAQQARLDDRLNSMARDLNQLIGATRREP
jgi:hypothetical protein